MRECKAGHLMERSRRWKGGMCLGEAAEEHLSADSDKGGLKGPFFFSPAAIHRQFVRAGCWSRGQRLANSWSPRWWLISAGLQELHLDVNEDKSATRLGECLISPSLSVHAGPWLRPSAGGIHRAKREVSPLLVINIFTTTRGKCTSGSRFGINWGLMLDNWKKIQSGNREDFVLLRINAIFSFCVKY